MSCRDVVSAWRACCARMAICRSRKCASRLGLGGHRARRDLVALEADKALKRTYGGALADYDQGFASFRDRQRENREGKTRIARAALTLVKPGSVIFTWTPAPPSTPSPRPSPPRCAAPR